MRLGLTVFPVFLSLRHCSRESAVFRSNFPALDLKKMQIFEQKTLRRYIPRPGRPVGCIRFLSALDRFCVLRNRRAAVLVIFCGSFSVAASKKYSLLLY